MEYSLQSDKLRALAVQLIETNGAAIIKRGRAEMKISGEQAGDVLRTLLPLAIRGATREELCARFPASHRESINELLDHLVSRRFFVPETDPVYALSGSNGDESGLDIFYWHFGTERNEVSQRLTASRVRIIGLNAITRQMSISLRASGAAAIYLVDDVVFRNGSFFDEDGKLRHDQWPLDLAEILDLPGGTAQIDPESVDCIVAASDFGSTEQLREWNEFCVLHNIYYLPVLLQDLVGYVGPLVRPWESACFECLRSRQNSHISDAQSRRLVESVVDSSVVAFHPSMASILGDLAALELLKLFGLDSKLAKIGSLIEVNFLGREMKARPVLKVPRCRVCSGLGKVPAAALSRAVLFPGLQG